MYQKVTKFAISWLINKLSIKFFVDTNFISSWLSIIKFHNPRSIFGHVMAKSRKITIFRVRQTPPVLNEHVRS